MSRSGKGLVTVTNLAIVIVALLLSVLCVKKYLLVPAKPTPLPPITLGTKISIANVDWSRSRRTFVVALQEGCHFCTESAPFYKRLVVRASTNKNLRLIAVLPQDPIAAQRYLDSVGVSIVDVKRFGLREIGISGTPTLLLLDDQGIVKASWVGRLSVDQENEVLRRIDEIALNQPGDSL
jgi:hypothetical protein